MRELLAMWRNPRMIALTGVVTVVYAVVLLPFKGLTIVPGIASVRPAGVLPVVFSLLFGPAAAWGSLFGNVVGDLLGGTWTTASYVGAFGNFLFGLVGYRLWGNLGSLSSGEVPDMATGEQFPEYLVVVVVAASITGASIAWGVEVLGMLPFSVLATSITLNNVIAGVVLGPPLLYVAYPRAERYGLLYGQLMDADVFTERSPERRRTCGQVFVAAAVGWLVVGIAISVFLQGVPFGAGPGPERFGTGGSTLQLALGAAALAVVVGCLLLGGQRLHDWQTER